MKRNICVLLFLIITMIGIISMFKPYVEPVTEKNCGICGEKPKGLMGYYRKRDTIGLICLNTGYIHDSDVIAYDDDGNELFGVRRSSTSINTHGESECVMVIDASPHLKESRIEIYYGANCILDMEKTGTHFCADCLKIIEKQAETISNKEVCREVAIIDFATKELYLLSRIEKELSIRDFIISINNSDDNSMDIDVVYRP